MRNAYWRVQRRIARRALAIVIAVLIVLAFWELIEDANAQSCPLTIYNSQPVPPDPDDFPRVPGLEVDRNGDGIADWAYTVGFVDFTGTLYFIGLQFRFNWETSGLPEQQIDPDACPNICVRDVDGRLEVTHIWQPTTAAELPRNAINTRALEMRPCIVPPPRPTNLGIAS